MKAIPVKFMRFNNNAMEVPGCHSSSLTAHCDPTNGNNKRHHVEYHPWVRQFWVEFYDRPPSNKKEAELVDSCYVPAEMVMYWKTLDGPAPSPAISRGKK